MGTDTALKDRHWGLPSADLCKRARTPRIEAAPLLPYGALVFDAAMAENLGTVMEDMDRDHPGHGFTREFVAKALLHGALAAAVRTGMGPAIMRMEAPPPIHPRLSRGAVFLLGMITTAACFGAGFLWGLL